MNNHSKGPPPSTTNTTTNTTTTTTTTTATTIVPPIQTIPLGKAQRVTMRETLFLKHRSKSVSEHIPHNRLHLWLNERPPSRGASPISSSGSTTPPSSQSDENGILINQQQQQQQQRSQTPIPIINTLSVSSDSATVSAPSSWQRSLKASSKQKQKQILFPIDGEASFRSEYEIIGQLGEGATSSVLLGRKKKTGEYVAIKAIPKKFVCKKSEFKKIAKEIPILKQLKHRNIIAYHDVVLTSEHIYIILEYAEGHELFDEILAKKVFTEQYAAKIVYYIVNALAYIHNQGIVHSDLKPENVIINGGESNECGNNDTENNSEPLSVKIIDFGLSRLQKKRWKSKTDKQQQSNTTTTTISASIEPTAEGTLGYRSPELITSNGSNLGSPSDMWALGVMTYIMLGGFPPFMSQSDYTTDPDTLFNAPFWILFNNDTKYIREQITEAKFSFPSPFWDDISEDGRDFVSRLLKKNPQERMTAIESLKHPWIASLCPNTPRRQRHLSPTRVSEQSTSENSASNSPFIEENGITAGDCIKVLSKLMAERREINEIPQRYFQEPERSPKLTVTPTRSPLGASQTFDFDQK